MSLEHRKRVVAAVVGVAALFGTYFAFGHTGLVGLTILISTAAYVEFLSFSQTGGGARWPAAILAVFLSLWLCAGFPGALTAVYVAALLVLLRSLWRVHLAGAESLPAEFANAQSRVFGLVYLVVMPSFVPRVHELPHGPALLALLLGIVWAGDIAGYYGGKAFGRHKLSPAVSPGKTREGAIAALLACAALAALAQVYLLPHLPLWKLVLIGLASSAIAQAGDLLESLMKRAHQVKDSGGLIPGHGGVFDRFDSLILLAPLFYLLLRLLA